MTKRQQMEPDPKTIFQWGIARRFIVYILLFSSAITLILTTIQLYMDYRYGLDSIEKSIRQIEVSYLDSITNSLWVSDMQVLNMQLEGMLKLSDMLYIDVVHDDETIAKTGEFQDKHIIMKAFQLSHTYHHKTVSLGTLRVVYTLKNLYDRLRQKAVVIVISQTLKTFMVSGFIFFIFYLLVARHLHAIAHYSRSLGLKTLDKPLILERNQNRSRKDEFDFLVAAINEMRNNLNHAYYTLQDEIVERRQIEKELMIHQDHLEELVEARTQELQKVNIEYAAANKDLKEFAYIVSHDLKAPLRAISQLTHWISNDYSHLFDDEGKLQMDLIIKRAKRMDALIEGILRYSRVGKIREKQELLDLNGLVKEVIDNLAPNKSIQIRVENKLPTILSDAIRMEQVFQNLIGNAIKFMDKKKGIIRVGCRDEDEFWKFSISDNGPGIDKKFHDKIFTIFQTLTPRDKFESTGIGLTLVKKIIGLYGGSVWVESEPGQGATFFFTLPKKGEPSENR